MFLGIFGLHLLQKSRKMSKMLLSQNKIKTILSHRSHQELSNGVNGLKNGHRMDNFFNSLLNRQTLQE
jgi:hypothetical protein